MARLPRLVVPNQPHHLIQRGHDGLSIFRDDQDFQAFLNYLREAARQFRVAIHAYVLMPDHLHLLATPADESGLARMMQWVGRQYVPYFNARYGRRGTLWQGRYRGAVLEAGAYLLLCSRYIELNPVRAQLVGNPGEYRWSSYAHHAGIRPDPLVTDHAMYWALGNTPFDREAAYRALIEHPLSATQTAALTEATLKGWPFGSAHFTAALARQLGRRASPARRGRPRKRSAAPNQE
jgi:putative transposase